MELIPQHQKKLDDFKAKLLERQAFAERIPFMAEQIIYQGLSPKAKDGIYFYGAHKGFRFDKGEVERKIFFGNGDFWTKVEGHDNNKNPFNSAYLWQIRLRWLDCDSFNHDEAVRKEMIVSLNAIAESNPVFHYYPEDQVFYVSDEQLEAVMDAIAEWGLHWIAEINRRKRELQKQELLEELKEKQKLLADLAKLEGV